MATGNFSGASTAVVVSAPSYGTPGRSQHGRIYVVDTDKDGTLPLENIDLDTKAHAILDGVEENGRFGTALAVVDLNMDGIDDLAVGASSTGLYKYYWA